MTRQELGEMHRTTTLCINHYENGVPSGTFHNPCMDGSRSFHGLTQLLIMMEDTLDSMSFPQSFTAVRSFAPPLAPHARGEPDAPLTQGTLATFAIKVLFRQNASWQGSLTWLEGGCEQSFRSVLELILLMDSALKLRTA